MILRQLLPAVAWLSIGLFTLAPVQAHSIRIIPAKPVVEPGGRPATVYLSWGHLLPVDELIDSETIRSYSLTTPGGSSRPMECSGASLQANAVRFDEPGVYQAAVAREPSIFVRYTDPSGRPVHAPGKKSEVEVPEGATGVLSARSSQFAKAVIVCGEPSQAPIAPLGHPIELVLETPVTEVGLDADATVRVRVLFEGKPLTGVTVYGSSTTLNPDGLPEVSGEADADGVAELELFEPGTWVLQVRHQVEAGPELKDSHDTESYTATLTVPVGLPE